MVQSAHKTLGSLTQSAFLHLGKGEGCMNSASTNRYLSAHFVPLFLFASLPSVCHYLKSTGVFFPRALGRIGAVQALPPPVFYVSDRSELKSKSRPSHSSR